ncbi:hypothetical protein [Nitrosomonas aestuarii]|uniref:hypothetical protein n=1 Tax=Nitrosomonas aestuarii TaxID=52441 RepID=UPI000D426769|nr:hypothetical protein [Nitrosomonas aestuarii]PTN12828.1 hypothetical protein C8R11_102103 [Nitrosomonas aestuarii]
MNEKTLFFLAFLVSLIALIYVEYIAEDSEIIAQECETGSSLSTDCIETIAR